MNKITKKKGVETWITYDFIQYFYRKSDKIYGKESTDTNIERDGQIMKNIIILFDKYDKPRRSVKKFLDWSIDKYVKNSTYTIPITLGFVSFWRWQYLKVKIEDKKKTKKVRANVELTGSTLDWIEQQKKSYRGDKLNEQRKRKGSRK